MNKNLTSILLIIIAIGIYFTFTRGKLAELDGIKEVNAQYKKAIDDFGILVQKRNAVIEQYNQLSADDRDRLEKMLPDNVDNVRLIIDVNGVAARHGLSIREVVTSADKNENSQQTDEQLGGIGVTNDEPKYDIVTLSFKVKSNYQDFINFLKDLESSLRIIDISKISLTTGEGNVYDYEVDISTYWLK